METYYDTTAQQARAAFSLLDMPSLYAVSFGLFAPGALMAARLRNANMRAAQQTTTR